MAPLFFPRSRPVAWLLLPILLMMPAAAALAILPGNTTGFGLNGGMIKLHEGSWDYATVDRLAGLSLVRSNGGPWRFGMELRNGYTSAGVDRPGDRAGWTSDSRQPFYTLVTQAMLGLDHLFTPEAAFSPFVGAGVGLTAWKVVRRDDTAPGWFATGESVTGYDLDGNAVPLEGTDLTLEVRLGARWRQGTHLELSLNGAYQVRQGNDRDDVGLSSLWGPEHVDANRAAVTAMVGLTWWLGGRDADGDGVPDDRDLCPDTPEDRDGWNDLDGCPDLDNDGDGIPDSRDACPNLAEDFDGFEDQDGCPERDNDGDGIADGHDRCPDEPEDVDGFEDQDGCPDPDNDGDGVPDARDRCPFTPRGVPVDDHGCPVTGSTR